MGLTLSQERIVKGVRQFNRLIKADPEVAKLIVEILPDEKRKKCTNSELLEKKRLWNKSHEQTK